MSCSHFSNNNPSGTPWMSGIVTPYLFIQTVPHRSILTVIKYIYTRKHKHIFSEPRPFSTELEDLFNFENSDIEIKVGSVFHVSYPLDCCAATESWTVSGVYIHWCPVGAEIRWPGWFLSFEIEIKHRGGRGGGSFLKNLKSTSDLVSCRHSHTDKL